MPDKYKVYWTESAENDLVSVIEYIYSVNLKAARETLKKIKSKVSHLNSMPQRGRVVPELKEHGVSIYREIMVPPWRVIFKIFEKNVFVLAVIDSRRNVEDILLERLIRKS